MNPKDTRKPIFKKKVERLDEPKMISIDEEPRMLSMLSGEVDILDQQLVTIRSLVDLGQTETTHESAAA